MQWEKKMSKDTIYREDAIKAFCNDCRGYAEPCEHQAKCKTMKVLRNKKKLPSADRPQEWIPCSERLPSGDTQVLVNVCVDDAPWNIILMQAQSVKEYYKRGHINAWMPLPEPWKSNI